jgi:hypothetical protein
MSSEAPPTYNVGIFIPSYWVASTTGFDKAYADTHYLKFPVAQGTEYMTDLVVSGTTTLGATSASSLSVTNKTTTANIDLVNSSSTLDMKSGSITNLTNINGSAYPQAAGLNSVLATSNTATNKDILMYGSASISGNNLQLSGDKAYFYSGLSYDNSTLQKDALTFNNTSIQSILASTGLFCYGNSTAPTINNTYLTSSDFTITGSSTAITNTINSTSNAIVDATNTLAQTSSLLSMYLTGSTTNSLSSSNLSNTALNIYDSASLLTYSSLTSAGLTLFNSSNIKNIMTNASSIFYSSTSTTLNKTTFSSSGFTIVGSTTNNTNTTSAGTITLNSLLNKNTIAPNGITQVLNADTTTNNSVLNNSSLTLIGSTTSITNTINSTSNGIADATYTGTLTSNALNLFTNSVSTSRNAITNTSMTITGSTTSTTNTSTSLSNIITDGTRTLTSGIVSSVATFKALASTGGASATIIPTSIAIAGADGTTSSSYSSLTKDTLSLTNTSSSVSIFKAINIGNTFGMSITADNFPSSSLSGAAISIASLGNVATDCMSILLRRTRASFQNSVGDLLGFIAFSGKSTTSTELEFARIQASVRNNGSTTSDGAIQFQATINSATPTTFLEINGDEVQINAFQPLDMNNNSIVSSIGGITLDTSSSASGNPYITLTPKASGGYIILNNLPTSSTGLPTGALYNSAGVLMVK